MILQIVIALVVIATLTILFFYKSSKSVAIVQPQQQQQQLEEEETHTRTNTNRTTIGVTNISRVRNRAPPIRQQEQEDEEGEEEEHYASSNDEDDEEQHRQEEQGHAYQFTEEEQHELSKFRVGTSAYKKLLHKLKKRKEKERRNELREQYFLQQRQKRELEQQRERELDLKREEEYQKRLEKLNQEKLEKKKKAQEEYEQWRHLFEEEEKGEAADLDMSQNTELLSKFIQYIKDQKVIILEELAYTFKMKTEQCIDRIKQLEQDGLLTGLLDDRGKFIYITEEELDKVKEFIEMQGRVSISELSLESNRLINLKPKEQEVNLEEIVLNPSV
jgi:hypothetical protein